MHAQGQIQNFMGKSEDIMREDRYFDTFFSGKNTS